MKFMGEIERQAKKKARRQNVRKIILQSIAAAGLLSVALLAPNALQMMDLLDPKKTRHKKSKYVLADSTNRLLLHGFIAYRDRVGGKYLCLTPKGEDLLKKMELEAVILRKPKRWDKKWRILIFDIPEQGRKSRDELRRMLINLGLLKLQNSVWVYPYDCEDVVTLLKFRWRIHRKLLYIIADSIEHDDLLKKHFKL